MSEANVEKCLEVIPNCFDLVLLVSQRAKRLMLGEESLVPAGNDKPNVVALREIAAHKIDGEYLLKDFGEDAMTPVKQLSKEDLNEILRDTQTITEQEKEQHFGSLLHVELSKTSDAAEEDDSAEKEEQE